MRDNVHPWTATKGSACMCVCGEGGVKEMRDDVHPWTVTKGNVCGGGGGGEGG